MCSAAVCSSWTIRASSVWWSYTSLKERYTHKCEGLHWLQIFNHNQRLWVPGHTQAHSLKQINLPFVLLSTSQPPPPRGLEMECPQPQLRVERRLKPDEWRSGTACSPSPYFTPPSLIKMRCGSVCSQGCLFQLREEARLLAEIHGRCTGQRVMTKCCDWLTLALQRFLRSAAYIPADRIIKQQFRERHFTKSGSAWKHELPVISNWVSVWTAAERYKVGHRLGNC